MGGLVSESLFRDINRVPLRREKCSIKTGTADCSGGRAFKYRSGHQLLRGGRKIRLPTDNYVIVVDVNDPVAREKKQCYQYNTFAAPPYKPVASVRQIQNGDQKCTGQKLKINNRRTNYEIKIKQCAEWRESGQVTRGERRIQHKDPQGEAATTGVLRRDVIGAKTLENKVNTKGSSTKSDPRTVELHECREAARSRGRYRPGWLEGYLLFAERAAVAKRKSAQNTSRTGPFKISGGVALIGTADD
ncbi:hypothetical protein J6590_068486 [Homalodisca vitripennis]|nr:hypothetical protein J6590_068486 [Homalodisca vitripennis]